jgi:hypothetical protein
LLLADPARVAYELDLDRDVLDHGIRRQYLEHQARICRKDNDPGPRLDDCTFCYFDEPNRWLAMLGIDTGYELCRGSIAVFTLREWRREPWQRETANFRIGLMFSIFHYF